MTDNAFQDAEINREPTGQQPEPYFTQVGNTLVRLSFQPQGESLAQRIKTYFLGLKL